ncbi:MAG: DMT family transporter [Paracoccaceae bacterium]|nr:DMT family transporter [Paracoccaceae bacterium]MDG1738652.1 DMT family transporter [Paracoccaceae bacterium]MDG2258106.1 DMT family transporter [Paracoccaceae bacterium]
MIQIGTATRAIIISLVALVLFDLMGLIIKHLSPQYSAAELSAYRNIFGVIPTAIALWSSRDWHKSGRKIRVRQKFLVCFRGVIVTFAQLMFYLSLGRIAFATASTITYSGALFTTVFAVLILNERVGVVRWGAVLVGFVGVLMVMGFGGGDFTWDAVLPLGAAVLYALTSVTARLVDDDVPTALINLYSTLIAVVGSGLIVLFFGGFSPLQSLTDFFWVLAMGSIGGTAVLCLIIAYRMTEQSNLAPFSYFGIPIAFFFGWLFYGEAPINDLFPGALLIAIGGLMVIWRERQITRRAKASAGSS